MSLYVPWKYIFQKALFIFVTKVYFSVPSKNCYKIADWFSVHMFEHVYRLIHIVLYRNTLWR